MKSKALRVSKVCGFALKTVFSFLEDWFLGLWQEGDSKKRKKDRMSKKAVKKIEKALDISKPLEGKKYSIF